ncbi:hypothetical protein [Leeuwenhoekiella marinoflava]|nr:hypothetical protein [Leeuwenhoekiella marinoflava]
MKFFWPLFAAFIMLQPAVPILNYVFNYDYIVDELCVNRDRPELNCKGRCYLMQALADEASKKKDAQERGAKNNLQLTITYFLEHTAAWEFELLKPKPKNKVEDCYNRAVTSGHSNQILRPPIFS